MIRRILLGASVAFIVQIAAATEVRSGEPITQSDSEIAYFPLNVETLVPVTLDSIWESPCRRILTSTEQRDWNDVLDLYKVSRSGRFSFLTVRIGIRFGTRHFYIDKDLAMFHSNGTFQSLTSDPQQLIALVNTTLTSKCGLEPAR
jgi:hypothetical protein